MRIELPTIDFETPRQLLERERTQVREERRAFERFERRLADLETTTPQLAGTTAATASAQFGETTPTTHVRHSPSNGLTAVTKAYTETVLAVTHYTAVYDESWQENMAEEFSEEVATAVEQATQLHPQLKRSLVDATTRATENRTQLLELLEAELEAITDADQTLTRLREDVQSLLEQPVSKLGFNGLRLTRRRLLALRERCDTLATERQGQIRHHRKFAIAAVGTFERYLYGDAENTYPVLAAIAAVGASIEQAVETVERFLVQCRS